MVIFRKLFGTGIYRALQAELQSERSKAEQAYSEVAADIDAHISEALSEEAFDGEYSNAVKRIEEKLAGDRREDAQLDIKIQESDVLTGELQQNIGRAEEFENAKASLNTIDREIEESQKAAVAYGEKLEEEERQVPRKKKITADLSRLESQRPEYRELKKLRKELDDAMSEAAKEEETAARAEKDEAEYSGRVRHLEAERQKLKDAGRKAAEWENAIARLAEKKRRIDDLLEHIGEFQEIEQTCSKAREDYLSSKAAYEKTDGEYAAMNRAFLDAQAGILAEDLVDGYPCPVCGSTDHPSPADKAVDAPTEAELKKLRAVREEMATKQQTGSKLAGELAGRRDVSRKNILKEASGILGEVGERAGIQGLAEDLSDQAAGACGKLQESAEQLRIERANLARLDELDGLIKTSREKAETAGKAFAEAKKEIAVLREKRSSLRTAVDDKASKLEHEDADKLEKAIAALKLAEKRIEEAYVKARSDREDAVTRLSGLTGRKKELEAIVERGSAIDLETSRQELAKIGEERRQFTARQQQLRTRIEINSSALTRISGDLDRLKETEARLKWVKTLSDTASGTLSGKAKIPLETYVQTAYFDRILNKANVRLRIMSENQYEFKRQRESTDKRSKTGLELDVIDHYNGSERSVATLSGGESFMASLSLALGLSDEIQSASGGIRLDTLFVDEGFGTLDEDTLAQAMSALGKIAENDRLIGIISHVAELKEKIGTQIVVTKNRTGGSSARIITE